MALKKDGRTWREQGEAYAEKASMSVYERGTYYGLLAVYCEMRHASGDDQAADEAAEQHAAEVASRRPAGVRVGGRPVR